VCLRAFQSCVFIPINSALPNFFGIVFAFSSVDSPFSSHLISSHLHLLFFSISTNNSVSCANTSLQEILYSLSRGLSKRGNVVIISNELQQHQPPTVTDELVHMLKISDGVIPDVDCSETETNSSSTPQLVYPSRNKTYEIGEGSQLISVTVPCGSSNGSGKESYRLNQWQLSLN